MTAPVSEVEVDKGKYAIEFFMPSEWSLETLPKPLDSRIILKNIPERTMFVLRYNGGWSEELYQEKLEELRKEARKLNMKIKQGSQPIWARYNSPMAPSPIRTNEIMFEVESN